MTPNEVSASGFQKQWKDCLKKHRGRGNVFILGKVFMNTIYPTQNPSIYLSIKEFECLETNLEKGKKNVVAQIEPNSNATNEPSVDYLKCLVFALLRWLDLILSKRKLRQQHVQITTLMTYDTLLFELQQGNKDF